MGEGRGSVGEKEHERLENRKRASPLQKQLRVQDKRQSFVEQDQILEALPIVLS